MPTTKPDLQRGLQKHSIRLRAGDAALLDGAYPDLGHNVVVRNLIAAHVDTLQAAKAQAHPAPELPDFEVPDHGRDAPNP